MKILHVLASNSFSGAENVACQIINMFSAEDNFEMAYTSPDGPIKETLKEKNIKYYPLKKLTKKELKKVIKDFNPDIIHAHDMRASFFIMKICGKTPFISHIHNNAFNSRKLTLKAIAYYFAAKKAKHIFWVSQSAFNGYYFSKYLNNKSTILSNVINEENLRKKIISDEKEYNYDIVFLGRLTYPKNPQRFINVIKNVVNKLTTVKIAVIGSGELETQVKQLSSDLELDDNIDFWGFLNNPYKILYSAKCLVMTSRWEGLPMCALEALALGVPVIATPVDGLKNIILNGENGYLSEDDNYLSEKIYEVITGENLRNELSQNCLKVFNEINNEENYKSIVKEKYLNEIC